MGMLFRTLAVMAGLMLTALTGPGAAAQTMPALREVTVSRLAAADDTPIHLNSEIALRLTGPAASLDQLVGQELSLFLGNVEMKTVTSVPVREIAAPGAEPAMVTVFRVKRSAANSAQWDALLSSRPGWASSTMTVSASVGPKDGSPTATLARINLKLFRSGWVMLAAGITVATFAVILWLARTRGLLRDPMPAEAVDLPGISVLERPYSLARLQMAVWLAVTLGAYLFLFLATGEPDSFSSDALVLLGVATGTTLGAVMVEAAKPDNGKADRAAARETYLQCLADLARPEVDRRAVEAQLAKAKDTLLGTRHKNWLVDTLTDASGLSLHRFQVLVWTIVLVVVFVVEVRARLAMPGFGDTLLALMGISNGAYLGGKVPEKAG